MASMDLLFRFLGVDAGAGREFDRMAAKADVTKSALSKVAFGALAAGGVVAAASVKMAADFQTSMTRIHTQADATNKTVATLSKGILSMAGAVATAPNDLAQAAFHVASFGQKSLTAAQQLDVLKIAAEGAKLGGADLVDVTNALDGVLATHVKGVNNYSQAMGALNATVGAGDMTMQDLAEALPKVGITAKQAGINLTQMGAALAVFGDNNLRGALAGTSLRMSIQALEAPAKAGIASLNAIGLSATKLAKDMQQGGLTKALDDLHAHMVKAGDTGKRVGAFLTDAFGKRAGQGLGYLEGELGRFHNKLGEVGKGATGFASSWKGYTKTFGYAWDNARDAGRALFIELGTKLLPVATKFMNWIGSTAIPALSKFAHWLQENSRWTKPLAIGLAAAGAAAMVAFGGPVAVIAGLAAIGAGLVYAYKHSQTFREVVATALVMVKGAVDGLKVAGLALWHALDAVWHGIDAGVQYVKARFADFAAFWNSHSREIRQVTHAVWTAISTVVKTEWRAAMAFIRPALTVLSGAFKTAFHLIKNYVTTGMHLVGDVFKTFEKVTLDFVGVILDVITGHWGKAWNDAKKLVSDAFNGIKKIFGDFAKGALHLLYQAGKDIVQGLINGVESMAKGAAHAVVGVGKGIVHGVTSFFGIGSPSKLFHKFGQWLIDGLTNGMTSRFGSARNAALLLAKGITEGWHGAAKRLEGAFIQPVQNMLDRLNTKIANGLSRQRDLLKKYTSNLKQDLQSRNQAISSLRSSIAGNAGISNVFGQDANGNPTVGNIRTYLTGQVGIYSRYASLFAKARKAGLAPGLLAQISGMAPQDAITLLTQITSGQDGSISSLNALQGQIGAYSKQIATGTVNTPHELATLRSDRREVHEQTRLLHSIDDHLKHFRDHPRSSVAITLALQELGMSDSDIRKLVARINRLERTGQGGLKPRKKT